MHRTDGMESKLDNLEKKIDNLGIRLLNEIDEIKRCMVKIKNEVDSISINLVK